jgi:hypothetical protein
MTTLSPARAEPGPELTATPLAGRLIGLAFVLTVALFLVALATL